MPTSSFRTHIGNDEVANNILKSCGVEEDIQKGGEGSKGGKVIGHTKSGKPIYEHKKAINYDKFKKEDHEDASKVHRLRAKTRNSEKSKQHHNLMATFHDQIATKNNDKHPGTMGEESSAPR